MARKLTKTQVMKLILRLADAPQLPVLRKAEETGEDQIEAPPVTTPELEAPVELTEPSVDPNAPVVGALSHGSLWLEALLSAHPGFRKTLDSLAGDTQPGRDLFLGGVAAFLNDPARLKKENPLLYRLVDLGRRLAQRQLATSLATSAEEPNAVPPATA